MKKIHLRKKYKRIFFAINTKLPLMQFWHQRVLQQQLKVTPCGFLSKRSSLDQESNTCPTELDCHLPVSLRLLDPYVVMLY